MLIKYIGMAILGVSFGALISGGVFTVLIAIGLIPRFAGKTHTAKKVFLYEEMVIAGTLFGNILSVFGNYLPIGEFMKNTIGMSSNIWDIFGSFFLILYGTFAGMFVGCLALAIAEMLDTIPIFARRIGFRKGLGIAVIAMALGKGIGSLIYFYFGIYEAGGL